MIKIQIIIDKDGELTGLTCSDLVIEHPTPEYSFGPEIMSKPKNLRFIAENIISDDSPNLISLPDELLLRIRDYNIDTEHQQLKDQIESLKDQVRGWELRRDLAIEAHNLAMEEWEQYHVAINKIIDKHPEVAAEVALQNGDLEAACYFAKKANEEGEDD